MDGGEIDPRGTTPVPTIKLGINSDQQRILTTQMRESRKRKISAGSKRLPYD